MVMENLHVIDGRRSPSAVCRVTLKLGESVREDDLGRESLGYVPR